MFYFSFDFNAIIYCDIEFNVNFNATPSIVNWSVVRDNATFLNLNTAMHYKGIWLAFEFKFGGIIFAAFF